MKEDLSPEERLLNLIKQEPATSSDSKSHQATTTPPPLKKHFPERQRRFITTQSFLPRIILSAGKFKNLLFPRANKIKPERPGLKFVSKVLAGICLLLTFYLVFVLFKGETNEPLKNTIASEKVVSMKRKYKRASSLVSKPYSFYSKEISRRDIFKPYEEQPPPPKKFMLPPEKKKPKKKVDLKREIENLSLVGVILGQEPTAIITDKKKNKTHYLHKNELIQKMKIKNIFKDKIILSSEGKEIDLRL